MPKNLPEETLLNVDPRELLFVIAEHFGHSGRYGEVNNTFNSISFPSTGPSCRITINFGKNKKSEDERHKITAIHPGPSFKHNEWKDILKKVEASLLVGAP